MASTPAEALRGLPNKWIVLLLLLGIAIFNHADRFLLAGLVDPIKAEFGVSDGFMGLLMGPAFAVFYSTLAIPIAIYADRANRIRIIVAGCVVWSVFTILSGYATGPTTLALARIGVGIGEAAFQAPAYSIIAAYFLADQRGKAFAVMALALYIGQMMDYGVGPAIAAATHRLLRPGRAFLVYQFSARARDFMAPHFARIDAGFELLNVLPCKLFWGWKE